VLFKGLKKKNLSYPVSEQQRIELPKWHGNTFGSMSYLPPAQRRHSMHGGLLRRRAPASLGTSVLRLQAPAGSVLLLLRAGSSGHSPNTEIITGSFSPLI